MAACHHSAFGWRTAFEWEVTTKEAAPREPQGLGHHVGFLVVAAVQWRLALIVVKSVSGASAIHTVLRCADALKGPRSWLIYHCSQNKLPVLNQGSAAEAVRPVVENQRRTSLAKRGLARCALLRGAPLTGRSHRSRQLRGTRPPPKPWHQARHMGVTTVKTRMVDAVRQRHTGLAAPPELAPFTTFC